jgi:predicted dehydrogenase
MAAKPLRFGVLGTGFWARTVHAAALATHPGAQLAGVWGRDLAKAKAVGAEFEVAGYADLDELLAQVDAVSIALPPAVQAPLAVQAAEAGKHLLLEKPIALSVHDADRVVAAAGSAGVASLVFVTARYRTGTSVWLQQAARTTLAGGGVTWLGSIFQPDSPFKDSVWRVEHGALWDLGPHALSLLVPALGPVESVQAGAGLGDTVHLVLTHPGGRASTATLSLTAAPLAAGVEAWVHGDAGRLVLLPDYESPVEAHQVAVDELSAAALTRGAHPCDARTGRDAVVVLAAAQRALATGCRESVAY